MTSKPASWKQKVDPAFDKIIKYFLKILNQSDLPANKGWLVLEDHYIKIMEEKGMQGWIKNYQYMIDEELDITKSILKKNEPLKERNKHLHDFDKYISESMKFLPEESREYYRKRFKPLFSEKDRMEYFGKMTKEELKDYVKYFVGDLFLLELHSAIVEKEKEQINNTTEVLQKRFSKPSMIMNVWTNVNNAISLLVFKRDIYGLIKEASNRDETAFFKLLQIDRTIIEFDWAKKMIRKAQLTGNKIFFEKMSKAIITDPLENNRIYSQALLVLLLFWKFGLYRLENSELISLLEETGIRVQDDPETFRKFVNREIRPLYQSS
jgi:hypothetical protein